jgi:hypothetical protein
MGFLDTIASDQGGGGLLDALLRSFQQGSAPGVPQMNGPNNGPLPSDMAQYPQPVPFQPPPVIPAQPGPQLNPQPSAMDNARWPYGPVGAPSNANAQGGPPVAAQPPAPIVSPPQNNAQPPSAAPPMFATTAAPPPQGIGERLGAGFRGMAANMGNGPLGMLMGGVAGVAGMGKGTLEQQQAKQMGFAANALIQKGVDPVTVQAAVTNPEIMKTLITQNFGPQTVTSLGEGYVTDKNGKVTRAYTPEQKDNFSIVQKGEDAMGNKTYVKLNKATGEETPVGGADAAAAPSGLGDMTKTGQEYLATLPPLQQKIVSGMIDGTVQPPSSFALAKKSWQAMLAAAKNVDPTFDENTWTARHKMTTDLAASGNSSMGGILSNGKSSFKHLAEFTDSAADLGNASHDFPLGGLVANAQNAVSNTLAGSDTKAKIKAINDNLGHYGQESTKFYSGTGGGAEERMNALKEINPVHVSGEEMGAYAQKEKSLMLDRLREKEAQIRDTMGDAYLQKHPVFTPELKADIARIDANTAKLKGSAPSSSKPATVTQNGHTYTLQPDGSYK